MIDTYEQRVLQAIARRPIHEDWLAEEVGNHALPAVLDQLAARGQIKRVRGKGYTWRITKDGKAALA